MKVIFLDFDGVLNSEASFRHEVRRKNNRVSDTLSAVACSNLQYVLEQNRDVKLVITSTWRMIHTMVELQNILNAYGVEAARVIGKTPSTLGGDRAREINLWLEDNPNVTSFVVIDDDPDVVNVRIEGRGFIFLTTPEDGLLFRDAKVISAVLRGEK